MTRCVEVDVVAVGAGMGGLTCALAAHDAGLRAVVIEKSNRLGGVTAQSGGHIWVPGNHLAAAAGIVDTWQAGADYIERIGAGTADRARLDSLLMHALEAYRFLEGTTELAWNLIPLADYYAETDPGLGFGRYLEASPLSAARLGQWQRRSRRGGMFSDRVMFAEMLRRRRDGIAVEAETLRTREDNDVRCGGAAIAVGLIATLLAREIPIMTDVRTKRLVRDAETGRVNALMTTVEGEETLIRARRGILLATGGYDHNAELVRFNNGFDTYGTGTHAGLTGDSLVMAGMHGARTAHNVTPFLMGFSVPGERDDEGSDVWRVVSPEPHSIIVNRSGDRFADEAHYIAVSHALQVIDGRTQERPNLPAYFICDSTYLQRCGLGGVSSNDALPTVVQQSIDIEDLGKKLEIDGRALRSTVDRFNDAVRGGRDADFRRGESLYERRMLASSSSSADTLGCIAEPPFYGVEISPVGVGYSSTGLVADLHGQLLDWEGEPMEGLYAAGNTLAMLEIGSGYQSGFANMRGMTYGYVAARHMAGCDAASA